MRISRVEISEETEAKILEKHGVRRVEVEQILFSYFVSSRISKNRYLAIGNYKRHITVFFELLGSKAIVATAYKSSKKQLKYFKKNG